MTKNNDLGARLSRDKNKFFLSRFSSCGLLNLNYLVGIPCNRLAIGSSLRQLPVVRESIAKDSLCLPGNRKKGLEKSERICCIL